MTASSDVDETIVIRKPVQLRNGKTVYVLFRHCSECGRLFAARRRTARYCGAACKQRNHRRIAAMRRALAAITALADKWESINTGGAS